MDKCYENVRNLKLKRYTWKKEIYSDDQINDRNYLGWIAQDVEKIYPKAVTKTNLHGRGLQADKIYKAVYGAVQKLMDKVETLENKVISLETELNNLKNNI